jgi:ABC-type sugar transport system substrate-binding protein
VIKKAMQMGIYVITLNMPSVQVADGYVGLNAPQAGRMVAQDIIKEIGGGKTSGEVMILEGDPAAPYSFDQAEAAVAEFKKDPSIKVVSRQPAFWDSTKAVETLGTVIQNHPKLAAIYSIWGPQAAGLSAALKNAGSDAKIWVVSEGQMPDCDLVMQGAFHKLLSYRANIIGENATSMALTFLQNKDKIKPGEQTIAQYSALYWVTGPNDIPYGCYKTIPDEMK